MGKIVVTGSLHYDIMLQAHHRPEKGETVMGTDCAYKFGGKGGNQALSAARAGAEVSFIGAVGDDDQGKFLLAQLNHAGVNTQRVAVLDSVPSGMSVAILDAENDYGAVVVSNANNAIDPAQFTVNSAWQNSVMLLLQNEVPESVNVSAAAQAKLRGVTVCLNAAPAREISAEMRAAVDLLVVNAVEARDLSGLKVADLASACLAAESLSRQFPAVVVTAGEYGVAWCEQGQSCQSLAAEKVVLVSTHGAGDCFMGVLAAALLRQHSLAEAVTLANQAAAEHVSRQPI